MRILPNSPPKLAAEAFFRGGYNPGPGDLHDMFNAVSALAGAGPGGVEAVLTALSVHNERFASDEAVAIVALALGLAGQRSDAVLDMIEKRVELCENMLVEALRFAGVKALQHLERLLEHPNPCVSSAAAAGLGELGSAAAHTTPAILRAFGRDPRPYSHDDMLVQILSRLLATEATP